MVDNSKLLIYPILLIIIIAIPYGAVQYFQSTDPYAEITQGSYELEFDSTNSSTDIQTISTEEFPAVTDMNIFINRTSSNESGNMFVYFLEDALYEEYLAGDLNFNIVIIEQSLLLPGNRTLWFNVTTDSQSRGYFLFDGSELVENVTISGIFTIEAEGWWSRNAFQVVFWIAVYVIAVFGAIPTAIKKYRFRKFRERKAKERMEEEEAFYRERR